MVWLRPVSGIILQKEEPFWTRHVYHEMHMGTIKKQACSMSGFPLVFVFDGTNDHSSCSSRK